MIDKTIIHNERYNYNFIPEASLLLLCGLCLFLTYFITQGVLLYGHKEISMIDIWTFEHIITGMIISHFSIGIRYRFYHPLALLLIIEFGWEVIEHYLETTSPEIIIAWFGGVEHWTNRIIADPMATILGFLIIKQFPHMISYARYISICFLSFHIFIAQNSMYFH